MKESAIISLLWSANAPVLKTYLQDKTCVVITPSPLISQEIIEAVQSTGNRIQSLDHLLSDDQVVELSRKAEEITDSVMESIDADKWELFCQPFQASPEKLSEALLDRTFLTASFREQLLFIEALNEADAKFTLGLVVVNDDYQRIPRTVVQWAKLHRIPSVHVEHALPALNFYTVHKAFYADHIALISDRTKEAYADIGCNAKNARITGFPNADRYATLRENKQSVRHAISDKYGFDPSLPLVVFGTTWYLNLSSAFDTEVYDKTIRMFFKACLALHSMGQRFYPLIKDRPPNASFGQVRVAELAMEAGLDSGDYIYTFQDTQELIAIADVVISVDSALSVEAMMAATPAINLLRTTGLRFGPCFAASDGVVEVESEPEKLAAAIWNILNNNEYRQCLLHDMNAAKTRYNLGWAGSATQQCAGYLVEMSLPVIASKPAQQEKTYVWERYLDVEDIEATGYHGGARSDLVEMFTNNPRFVLDIGCSAGGTGAVFKQKYPEATVWGVETNRAAAEIASTRLDRVLIGKFEDFDLEMEGIPKGSIDGVIVADVLEHMYNPWRVMTTLRPYMSEKAQVVASIPNVRNLKLMEDMSRGYWRYEPLGLLDVTHIRFFTYKEIKRFFNETGYHVINTRYGIDARLADVHQRYLNKCPVDLELGRMVIKSVTEQELNEFCSLQFYMVAEAGAWQSDVDEYYSDVSQDRKAYETWRNGRYFTSVISDQYELRMKQWDRHPKFHLIILANNPDMNLLGETIRSLTNQYYYNLCISVVSEQPAPEGALNSERFEWVHQADNAYLVERANEVLKGSDADWFGMMHPGDAVAPHAFLQFAEASYAHPDWRVIYSDEDKLNQENELESPVFKPDFNLDLLRSQAYIGGLFLISSQLFRDINGFDFSVPGFEEHDFALRAYEANAMFGHLSDVLFHRRTDSGHCSRPLEELLEDGKKVTQSHMERLGLPVQVMEGIYPGSYRIKYQLTSTPLVSILIPFREGLQKLQRCIDSIIAATKYPNYEIIVLENGCKDSVALDYLDGIDQLNNERIRVFSHPEKTSLSHCFNLLSGVANGELLVLMHFDGAIIDGDWLEEMVSQLQRREVGLISPRILRSDGKVRDVGAILGLNGAAVGLLLPGISMDHSGYYGRAHIAQNLSVLSQGSLGIRAEIFQALGGFNHSRYSEYLFEADLCLRAIKSGLINVWTPHANVLCDGALIEGTWEDDSATREKVLIDTFDNFREQWWAELGHDAAYNDNFTLAGEAFIFEDRVPLTWRPLSWKPLPKVLAHHADDAGCGEYRVKAPIRALVNGGRIDGFTINRHVSDAEMSRFSPDLIVLQRQILDHQIPVLKRYKRFSGARLVFESDDLMTNVPEKNPHKQHLPANVEDMIKRAMPICDMVTVTTQPLAEAYRHWHDNIHIIPNYIERAKWGNFKPQRRYGKKPRVGWAGSISHVGDLELLQGVVKALSNEVEWVFMGLCPEALRPYVHEFHTGVPLIEYPAKLASLNLDLAIAPLEMHPFNECKSNLRLLEYGVLGYPVVCTDIVPYQGDLPVVRVKNTDKQWVKAIRELVSDLDACAAFGDRLRDKVNQDWVLEDNLDIWINTWFGQ